MFKWFWIIFSLGCPGMWSWSGRKRRKWVFLIVEQGEWAQICPASCRNMLLAFDKPTTSELCQKSWIIENNICVWRPLVRPLCKPALGMKTVGKKNVPSANGYKFRYIFSRRHSNFETKMRFLCGEQKLVLWRLAGVIFSFHFLCESVSCSYDATAMKSPLF